ncbi:MAG TPA: DUF2069 domain-containing protein [Alcaligenaceae bacterium]|nr:DUF2069 domain-containing protein [Alcaligenaceae bacterium]
MKQPVLNPYLHYSALFSLIALFALCIAWEIWLDPLKPGGTLWFLKALPLAFAFKGVSRGSLYTVQWASMLILLYLMEGVVRVMSSTSSLSVKLSWIEIVLSTTFFLSAIFYAQPSKKAAKLAAGKRN